jgi:hypothetical protein
MIGMGLAGERELKKLLKELGPRIERKVTRGAMVKAARPIIRGARQNLKRMSTAREEAARVAFVEAGMKKGAARKAGRKRRHRGDLARSIGYRQKSYTAQGVVFVAAGPKWPQGAHGHLVEFGHRIARGGSLSRRGRRTTKKATGRAIGFVPAYPFMRPAYEMHKREALTLAIQEHRARVEREAQKLTYHARAGKIGATWTQIHARGG